jgi:hypothetical protein
VLLKVRLSPPAQGVSGFDIKFEKCFLRIEYEKVMAN